VLSKLINKYGSRIEVRFIGCRDNYLNIAGIIYNSWSLAQEVNDLQNFDIGVMPVWDDDWTKGKCAFKIIQYMAVGASVVASLVGVNKEVIKDGENGFLAADEEDWLKKLSLLIDNVNLRDRFALKGREKVEKEYSVKITAPKFVAILEQAYGYDRK
jgi:glycosyltransferase involved in cell wall biosynthesis